MIRLLNELWCRLRILLFRRRAEREMAEEMAFHIERETEERIRSGASPAQARREALLAFGGEDVWKEATREAWGVRALDLLAANLRYAIRGLRRSPGYTATVVATLALGIGANTMMFNVLDQLMFRPLAFLRDPGSVHRIYWQWEEQGGTRTTSSTTYLRYLDFQAGTSAFSAHAGFSERDLAVGEGAEVRERRIAAVSASYFDFFEARPVLGRFFTADEDRVPRGADVVVLSHGFWQSEFGGGEVLGDWLQVGDVRARIIGVAPPGFAGVNDAVPPVLWIPITTYAGSSGSGDSETYFTSHAWSWLQVLVRRRPDATLEAATLDAGEALRRSWRGAQAIEPAVRPVEVANPRAVVAPVRPGAGPAPGLEARTALWVSVVAGLVLLIACANVANLGLARALRRRRETAVRLALGSGRGRLLAQSLVECTVLALMGAVAAVLVAEWGGGLIRRTLLGTPTAGDTFADGRSLAVTFGIAVLVGLVVGVVPGTLLGSPDVRANALRGGARASARDGTHVRASLLVLQTSLSVTLLVGAVLFLRSLRAVEAFPMGYDADRVVLVSRVIRGLAFEDSVQVPLRRLLLETAQAIPEVESAAWVSSAPFVSTSASALHVQGIDSVGALGNFTYQATTPDYFRTMGTRILRGRSFTATDGEGAPEVMVVSESMARALWPGQDPLGRCVRVRSETEPCRTVIGVAEDMVQNDLMGGTRYHYYMPIEQFPRTWGNGMLLRLHGDPAIQGEQVRAALQRVMPAPSYVTVRPLREVVDGARRSWRLGATLFTAFGALALLVAAVGLYGVINYNVAQRRNELGIRAAIGARPEHLLRLVVMESVRFTLLGVGIGLLVAAMASRFVEPLLFQQSARDPLAYGGVAVLMIAVALAASALPGSRAGRTDPSIALRAEGG